MQLISAVTGGPVRLIADRFEAERSGRAIGSHLPPTLLRRFQPFPLHRAFAVYLEYIYYMSSVLSRQVCA